VGRGREVLPAHRRIASARTLGRARPRRLPVTEALAAELLSPPIFPGMTEAQVSAVVDAIRDYFAGA
jgi:dTDP-4-amino-4,6-dideoxygalactose transaminase